MVPFVAQMEKMAARVVTIPVVVDQEKSLIKVQALVSCRKSLTAVVVRGSYGKSQFMPQNKTIILNYDTSPPPRKKIPIAVLGSLGILQFPWAVITMLWILDANSNPMNKKFNLFTDSFLFLIPLAITIPLIGFCAKEIYVRAHRFDVIALIFAVMVLAVSLVVFGYIGSLWFENVKYGEWGCF